MENNEITFLVNKIKLDKELMVLDINFIELKELLKIINEKTFNIELINLDVFNEIKVVVTNIIKIRTEINFLKNNLNYNKNKC